MAESAYREPESHQNARPFGSSMAERQCFGCLDTWPCNCKQIPSLRFPMKYFFILYILSSKKIILSFSGMQQMLIYKTSNKSLIILKTKRFVTIVHAGVHLIRSRPISLASLDGILCRRNSNTIILY